jgi:hypothetical protein
MSRYWAFHVQRSTAGHGRLGSAERATGSSIAFVVYAVGVSYIPNGSWYAIGFTFCCLLRSRLAYALKGMHIAMAGASRVWDQLGCSPGARSLFRLFAFVHAAHFVFCFFVWRGFIYSKGAREPQLRAPPPREGGGGANNRFHPNRCRSRLSRPRNLGRTGLRGRGAQEDTVW